jgi:hypothetical protein
LVTISWYPPDELCTHGDVPLSNPPFAITFEQPPGVGVLVGVLVGVFVGVLVGVFVGTPVGVFVGVLVAVLVGPGGDVGVRVGVLVGVLVAVGGGPPHPGNLNAPMRVRHGADPVVWMYSVVIQNVQSSVGSIDIIA